MINKFILAIVLSSGLGLAHAGRAQTTSRTLAVVSGGSGSQTTAPVLSAAAPAPAAVPEVLTYADEMPVFPGGDAAFHQYLAQKIEYPAEAKRRNLSGTVYVRFVVDEQGRVRDAEVAKGCGNGFDEEALRLVRLMPWWTPGRQAGQPVRVARTLPIIFRLNH